MARKKTQKAAAPPPEKLTHNPFGALLGAAELPPGPPSAEPEETIEPLVDGPGDLPRRVVLSREKKGRGGKTVTRVRGIGLEQRDAVLQRMKRALGCGGALEEDDFVLLGDVSDRAAEWLEREGVRRVIRGN